MKVLLSLDDCPNRMSQPLYDGIVKSEITAEHAEVAEKINKFPTTFSAISAISADSAVKD